MDLSVSKSVNTFLVCNMIFQASAGWIQNCARFFTSSKTGTNKAHISNNVESSSDKSDETWRNGSSFSDDDDIIL